MKKSNFLRLKPYFSRKEIASVIEKTYIKNGITTIKKGVGVNTISIWYGQGYVPTEYHQSIVNIPGNDGTVTMDDLHNDLKNIKHPKR